MKLILIFITTIFLCSCVGTIEETRFETTEVVADAISYEDYVGIDEVIPISHYQVEVYFPEIENIQSDKVAYQIYYDGAEFPIYIPGNSLVPRADGRLMYTVDGLIPNREYYFEVQVTNLITGEKSQSEEKRSATTFPNRTASFDGVQSVTHKPGPDGMNFIKVTWTPAKRESSGLIPLPADVSKYEVTVLSSSRQLTDFDNENLANDERKVVYFSDNANYGVVGGLQPGETYFIRVRAIHYEFYDESKFSELKHEENNKYLSITMLTNDSSDLDFDPELFSVLKGDGQEALTSAKASWGVPTGGAFNHFRIYYKGVDAELISLIDESLINLNPGEVSCEMNPATFFCRRFDFSENSANILDLTVNYRYSFILAVCLDETCRNYQLSNVQSIETKADIATFLGFGEYGLGDSFNTLSKLYVEVTPPDLLTGVLDEVIVYFDIDGGDGNWIALNPPSESFESELESPLTMEPYNFSLDDQMVFDGIDVRNLILGFLGEESLKSYYFKYKRYTQIDGAVEDDFLSLFVVTPQLKTVTETINVRSCQISSSFTKINWRKPSSGVFTHFRIDVLMNEAMVDTIFVDHNLTEFSKLNYFFEIGGDVTANFSIKVQTVIFFEDREINQSEYGVAISDFDCN